MSGSSSRRTRQTTQTDAELLAALNARYPRSTAPPTPTSPPPPRNSGSFSPNSPSMSRSGLPPGSSRRAGTYGLGGLASSGMGSSGMGSSGLSGSGLSGSGLGGSGLGGSGFDSFSSNRPFLSAGPSRQRSFSSATSLAGLPPLPPFPRSTSNWSGEPEDDGGLRPTFPRMGSSNPSNLSRTRPIPISPTGGGDPLFASSSGSSSSSSRRSGGGGGSLRERDPPSRADLRREIRNNWENHGELDAGLLEEGNAFDTDDEADEGPEVYFRGRRMNFGGNRAAGRSISRSGSPDLPELGSSRHDMFGATYGPTFPGPSESFGGRSSTSSGRRSRRNSTSSLSGGMGGLDLNLPPLPELPSLGSAPRSRLPPGPVLPFPDADDLPWDPPLRTRSRPVAIPQAYWNNARPRTPGPDHSPPRRQPWGGYGELPSSISQALPPTPPLTGTRGTAPQRYPEFDRATSTFLPLAESPEPIRGRSVRRRSFTLDFGGSGSGSGSGSR